MNVNSEIDYTNSKKRVWGFWATVGWGILVMFVSGVVQVVIAVIFIIYRLVDKGETDPTKLDFRGWLDAFDAGMLLSLAVVASAVVGVILVLVIIKVRRGASIVDYLGMKQFGTGAVIVSIIVPVAFVGLTVLVNIGLEPSEDIMVEAYHTSVWPALFWVAFVVFAPVFEELLFRGLLFEGFSKSKAGTVGAIFLTAMVWAVFHVQYGPIQIATIFFLGIIIGVVRARTGSIWPPMIIHGLNNLLAIALISFEIGV